MRKEQAILLMPHILCHPTRVCRNDWETRLQGPMNDQRRVLAPDGGNHNGITAIEDLFHDCRVAILAQPLYALARRSRQGAGHVAQALGLLLWSAPDPQPGRS